MQIEDSNVVIDHYVDCNGVMVGLMPNDQNVTQILCDVVTWALCLRRLGSQYDIM